MKTAHIILSAAWIATVVAAFTIGSKLGSDGTSEAQEGNAARQAENGRSSQRVATRDRASGTNLRGGSSRDRTGSDSASDASRITTIMSDDNPVARAEALIELINRLGANDFEQTVSDFRELGITRERMSEYAMLLHAWAKIDPLAALDYAKENTGTPFARQTILASWAADNPEAALDWANKNHEGEGANPWLVGVIRGIVASNPTRATEIMAMLPYSRERGTALESIAPHIARQGTEKATAWLESISDERLRAGGAAYIADIMANSDPAAAADWVMNLKDPDAISRAAGEVAGTWADSDLNAAVAWTDSLPEGAKTRAAREVIARYASEDAERAASWMGTMSDQPEYERIVTSYIWHSARNNPELSLAQVPNITDERSRNRYYERIVGGWHQRDADAAKRWVEQQSNISDSMKERLLRAPDRDRRDR